jgi:CDGSH-type Zn-finger protein
MCSRLTLSVSITSAMTKVIVKSSENGPNLVMVDGKTAATLCRRGQSKMPYCHGTHKTYGFTPRWVLSLSSIVLFQKCGALVLEVVFFCRSSIIFIEREASVSRGDVIRVLGF